MRPLAVASGKIAIRAGLPKMMGAQIVRPQSRGKFRRT